MLKKNFSNFATHIGQMNIINETIHSFIAFGCMKRTVLPTQMLIYPIEQIAAAGETIRVYCYVKHFIQVA